MIKSRLNHDLPSLAVVAFPVLVASGEAVSRADSELDRDLDEAWAAFSLTIFSCVKRSRFAKNVLIMAWLCSVSATIRWTSTMFEGVLVAWELVVVEWVWPLPVAFVSGEYELVVCWTVLTTGLTTGLTAVARYIVFMFFSVAVLDTKSGVAKKIS